MRRVFAAVVLLVAAVTPPRVNVPVVVANDNRVPAGRLVNGVLTLDLVATTARWYPEDSGASFVDVAVFAEEGQRPQIPGPLIRVPSGTRLKVTVRNALPDSTIALRGLGTAPADTVANSLAPGGSRTFDYRVDVPGTFLYSARTTPLNSDLSSETEQLAGAIVVDAPGERTDDRVLVINIWGEYQRDSSWREALAINGKSWPNTERLDATVGDTLRWRVVNGSIRPHPMHLHGAYFRVDARGTGLTDTVYQAAQRRMAVTETLRGRQTMRMTWSPDEPGNWLFHCHLSFHVIAAARLDPPQDDHAAMLSGDPGQHMAGLIMGIHVRPRPGDGAADRRRSRRLSVYVVPGVARDTAHPRPITLLAARDGREPPAGAMRAPGDLLVLTRGEPTDITVHNRLAEATAIHWHGLELESWSDGVPGWSGQGGQVAPPIAPGDSFTARLTLKRAGTFIYHTHLNDIAQLTAGLYGPLVVLEPGQRWDPSREFLFVCGVHLPTAPGFVVNGVSTEPPLELRAGRTYRFRFINIAPALDFEFQIRREGQLAEWREVAKDGFDLPAAQAVVRPAIKRVWVGETFDAEFTPRVPGTYVLTAPPRNAPNPYERKIIVR